ncbi:integrase core domain-containing protein [uncultured Ilyobacter sp.]|uniref:integrase core domain-containing protein n=1 Tax=uncultured Ilyobacter sp. TaxID=544433 RepID=UPI0029F4F37F|nr:integrase core domain-containing protein [uncultured Ilyobacter sp.]
MNRRLEIIPEELYIRSDNGSQFISKLFSDTCRSLGINHERIPNATPDKNAHIESFHSILEREAFGYKYFESFQEAYKEMQEFIYFYNTKIIHGSLKYMTPQEFYEKYKGKESEEFKVAV